MKKIGFKLIALIFGFIVTASVAAGGLLILITHIPREENGLFIDYPDNRKVTNAERWKPPSKGVTIIYLKEAEKEECIKFDRTWKDFIKILRENSIKNVTAIRIVVDRYPDKMYDKLAGNTFYEWYAYLSLIGYPLQTPVIILLKDGKPIPLPIISELALQLTPDQIYNITLRLLR